MKRARYLPTSEMLAIARSAFGATFELPDASPRLFEVIGEVAVVCISGPLTRHDDWLWDSYDSIKRRISAALASPCRTIVMRIDSPGGEAIGCFDMARELRAMATQAKKPLLAFADGMIASAAYALACAASKIYVPSDGFVGSIGVKKALVDATGQDRMMGLSITVIGSGERKLDGDPHLPTSEAAKAEAQAQVDSLAALFFDLVAEARGVSAEQVKGLEAGMFHGAQAVSAKLADGVVTFNELLAMVASGAQPKATTAAARTNMNKEEMRAWLSEKAKGEGDDAEKAKAALKCLDEEAPPADDKKDDGDKKDAKAEGDSAPPKDDKKDADGDKDSDAKALALAATARVHALEASIAAKAEAEERAALLAQRPDFSAETRATLANPEITSMKGLREAVKTWPKIPANPAAAISAQGTRGDGQTGDATKRAVHLSEKEKSELDERMGLSSRKSPIRREGNAIVFGAMSGEDARAHTAAKAAGNGGSR